MNFFDFQSILVQDISPAYLSVLLQLYREETFSGLFHLKQSKGEVLLFLAHGELKLSYMLEEGRWKALRTIEQESLLQRIGGDLRVFRFHPAMLRLLRLYVENGHTSCANVENYAPNELLSWLEGAFREHGHGIACIKAQKQAGLILTYPDGSNPQDIVTWNESGSQHGPLALNLLENQQGPFDLAYFPLALASEAWKEYQLYVTLQKFLQLLFQRFRYLAGQAMTKHVSDQMNHLCSRQNWHFTFQEGLVFHAHFFSSIQEAQQVYQKILQAVENFMGLVIGESFVRQTFQEMQKRLPTEERQVIASVLEPQPTRYPSMEIA